MQNSTFDPASVLDFTKYKVNKYADAIEATVTAGTTSDIDYELADDMLLHGGSILMVKNAAWGDYVKLQIVHPQAGVLATFVNKWFIDDTVRAQTSPTVNYPGKVVTGLKLRIKYTSTGQTDVEVKMNWNLEKVIV